MELKDLTPQQLSMIAQGMVPNTNPNEAMLELEKRGVKTKADKMSKKSYAQGGIAFLKPKKQREMTPEEAAEYERLIAQIPGTELPPVPQQPDYDALISQIPGVSRPPITQEPDYDALISQIPGVNRPPITEEPAMNRLPMEPQGIGAITPQEPVPIQQTPALLQQAKPALQAQAPVQPRPQTKPQGITAVQPTNDQLAGKLLTAADARANALLDVGKGREALINQQLKDLEGNPTQDKRKAIYKAIGEIGLQLLMGESVARSGAMGMKKLQEVLASDEAKRKAAKDKAFELGLQLLEEKAARAGIDFDKTKLEYELMKEATAESREERKLRMQEQNAVSERALRAAQGESYRASAAKDRASGTQSGGIVVKPTDVARYEDQAKATLAMKGLPTDDQTVLAEATRLAYLAAVSANQVTQQGISGLQSPMTQAQQPSTGGFKLLSVE